MKLKRVNWGHGYLIILRNDRGHIIARRKWSKNFTLSKAEKLFKKNHSFSETLIKTKLVNVTEVVDWGDGRIPKRAGCFQAIVKAVIGDNKEVVAGRSKQYDLGTKSKREAMIEARENFYRLIDKIFSGGYDSDDGEKIVINKNISMKEGFVYYV